MAREGISKENREKIKTMFFGPYEEEWRDSRGRIDNSAITIAKRLGLDALSVDLYLTRLDEEHFEMICQRVNLQHKLR